MKTKLTKLAVLAASCLSLFSCMDMTQTISLNKDGSGELVEEIYIAKEALEQMQAMSAGMAPDKPAKDPLDDMANPEKLKAAAALKGEGVSFDKVERLQRPDGSKGMKVTYKFTDINKLTMKEGLGPDANGPRHAPMVNPYKYADGKLTFTAPYAAKQAEQNNAEAAKKDEEQLSDEEQMQQQQMLQFMKGMRMKQIIKIPGGIAKTNAKMVSGDQITLMNVDFEKFVGQDAKKLKQLDLKGAKLEEALKNAEGIQIDIQEQITVELK